MLATLWQKPMHPYEIAQTLRRQGKDSSTKINYGSLYTVVQSLEKHGFVEVTDVERQGNRPERTVYGITEAGRQETTEWMSDLVAFPAKEFPIFETALSLLGVLHPDEVVPLLEERLDALEVQGGRMAGARWRSCTRRCPGSSSWRTSTSSTWSRRRRRGSAASSTNSERARCPASRSGRDTTSRDPDRTS